MSEISDVTEEGKVLTNICALNELLIKNTQRRNKSLKAALPVFSCPGGCLWDLSTTREPYGDSRHYAAALLTGPQDSVGLVLRCLHIPSVMHEPQKAT